MISFDYLLVTRNGIFLNGKVEPSKVVLKILVVNDSRSKYIGAHVVSTKGAGADRYAVEKLRGDIAWLGYTKVLLKSDNEAAIVQLLTETLKSLRIETVDQASPAHPPAYDSKANGAVENAVRQVQGLLRTLKLCLEDRLGKYIPVTHALIPWLVEHTCMILNTRHRGDDGCTSWMRIKGRTFNQRILAFGETILYKLPGKGPRHDPDGNMGTRWRDGIFLGFHRSANVYMICGDEGILTARSLMRRPPTERWSPDRLAEIRATPWSVRERPEVRLRFQEGRPPERSPRCPARLLLPSASASTRRTSTSTATPRTASSATM